MTCSGVNFILFSQKDKDQPGEQEDADSDALGNVLAVDETEVVVGGEVFPASASIIRHTALLRLRHNLRQALLSDGVYARNFRARIVDLLANGGIENRSSLMAFLCEQCEKNMYERGNYSPAH